MMEKRAEKMALWKRATVVSWSLIGIFALPPRSDAGTTACFDGGDPAVPVPEFVNGERIWPPSGLHPSNPGEALPPERDSTRYVGLPSQLPGAGSGLELFTDLDIVGNYLYTAYNSGFQVWDISGTSAANPVRMHYRDGWAGHFLKFERTPTEVYFLIFGIDAIDPPTPGEDVLVALAGHNPVGLSIWDATNKSQLRELYQDWDRWGEDVATAHINDRTYAFFAVSTGGDAGLHVYDMTSARSLATPCLEDTTASITCPDVYKGKLGNWSLVRFVSYLKRNNRHYIAVSDGGLSGIGVDIHEIVDPSVGWSSEIFSGLSPASQGVGLFEQGGRAYLAVKGPTDLQIFDVTTCLDSRSCTTLQSSSPVWSMPVGSYGSLVSVSQADAAYVYFGFGGACLQGTKKEYLFNVGGLGSANPAIEEATAFPPGAPAGQDGIFADPQGGQDVDYWGYYLDKNSTGFSYLIPRAAKAHRAADGTVYVYRTAFSVLDVHQFGGTTLPPNEPSAIVDLGATESANDLWLGDDISFVATPQNCSGLSDWQWWYVEGGQMFNLGLDDATHADRWAVGTNRLLDLGATKLVCDSGETMTDANVLPQQITLKDPRPVVPGIEILPAGSSYPYGQQLTFSSSATIAGKQPLSLRWQVSDGSGTVINLPNADGNVFNLNTCDLPFNTTDVFADAFESGDISRWSFASSNPAAIVSDEPLPDKGGLSAGLPPKAAGASFTVELKATSTVDAGSFSDMKTVPIEIVQPGTPAFDDVPLSSADLGLGSYELTTHTNGLETEVRWELEDDNGTASCNFGSGSVACVVLDWGQNDSPLRHQWTTPNVEGPHKVRAAIRSIQCDGSFLEASPEQIDVPVANVTTPVAPKVTGFRVLEGGAASCSCPGFGAPCVCNANQAVLFEVTTDVPVTSIELTWNDGHVDTVSPSADNQYSHSYAAPNFYMPTVKAIAGGLSSLAQPLPETYLQIQ